MISFQTLIIISFCCQVFLRESLEHRLEKQREVEVLKAAMIIQAHVMGYVARYGSEIQTPPSPLHPSSDVFCRWCPPTQEAVQEAAAVHRGHSEELPGFLLEEEVPAAPLGSAHLPEAHAGPAGPPGLRPAAGGEEEAGGGRGAPEEDGGGDGEVSQLCDRASTIMFLMHDHLKTLKIVEVHPSSENTCF